MGSGDWTQVLVHARHTLYQLSHFLPSHRQWLPKITSGSPTPWGCMAHHCPVYSISEHRWSELKTLPDSWEIQLLCWIRRHTKFQMTHPQVWCHPERTDVNWELYGLGVWKVTVETIFHITYICVCICMHTRTHTWTDSYIFIHRLHRYACTHSLRVKHRDSNRHLCRSTYAYTYVHEHADRHIQRPTYSYTNIYTSYTHMYIHTYHKYT